MDFHDIVKMINKFVDENDLVSARSFIEQNIDLLVENKHLLRSNARELVEFKCWQSTVKPRGNECNLFGQRLCLQF